MLKKSWFKYSFAFIYFLITVFLFLLPGSSFPTESWFTKIPLFDKWVHVAIFFLLVIFFCWAANLNTKKNFINVLIASAAYGLAIEFVQENYVAYRSFDWGDWLADITGSIAGIFLWSRYKKNRPL